MRRQLISLTLIALSVFLLSTSHSVVDKQPKVLVATVDGVINPVAAEFIGKSIEKSSEMNAEALIIKLDTPGGLMTSMRIIVKDILDSRIPVVVYVSPSGSRAGSAGAFITMAAHVAAMAPGTTIGAAHPVAIGGERREEEDADPAIEKAMEDAATFIRSLAELRKRNAEWAESAVRDNAVATDSEALDKNVVDLVAKDLNTLLAAIDGKKIKTIVTERTLKTANAEIINHEMGIRQQILNVISNPNVAYLLMLLGFYGLFFELMNPGSIFPGVVGGICLIIAFYSLQMLPINYAGLLLILVGIILFILEVMVTSYGMLTIGGIASLVLGSLMLIDSPLPYLRISLSVILPAAIVTAFFFVITFRLAYKAHKRKPVTGTEGLIGLQGIAKTDITPDEGMVIVSGEIWSAYSDNVIQKDMKVVVEKVEGLRIKVSEKKR